jgi:hypothetical protein
MEHALLAELLAEFRAAQANSTEAFARFRSSITNDVLDSGLYVLDSNGLATASYQTPYGSLWVLNLGGTDMVVASSPPGSAAPTKGRGIHIVPAHSGELINIAGTAWTIYGTAGDPADVQAFTRAWPPAAGGTLVSGGVASSPFNDVGGAGAPVVRTFAAVAGQRHRLTAVSCSYSAAASTGTGLLTVADGATVVHGWDVPLAVNSPFTPPLPAAGIQGSLNTALAVTLAAGAAGTVGRLNTAKLTA